MVEMIGRIGSVECYRSYVLKMVSNAIVTLVSGAMIVPTTHSIGRTYRKPLRLNKECLKCRCCEQSVSPPLALNRVERVTASRGFDSSARMACVSCHLLFV